MKVLNYTGLQNLWMNIRNYITAHTPTKTSDLTNDSNFVDTSNSAVSSGITSAKVTSYDSHIADTDIHVTTADKTKWNNGVSQAYVFRYSSTALVASSTNSNTLLDNTDNLKVGDKVIDSNGVLFSITAIDTQNSTFTIGTALVDLAQDSDVVHKSGNEYITDTKTFGKGTLIVDNSSGSNVHGEIKLAGSRSGYIVADSGADGVFDSANCGISILLQDSGKPLHIGGYKVDANGRVFADNTNKNPVLSITPSLIQTATLVPENDSTGSLFRILSKLDYANGDASKFLDVRFQQNDDADATSAIYSYVNNKTSLGTAAKRWSGVYSTSYYYGNDNVEFSTKFVTTDTNQTISGTKTFSDLQIIGYGTQYKGSRNAYILPEFAAGYSGLSITTMGFAQALKIGNFVLDANNKPSLDTSKAYIQISTGESNGVNACLLESRNSTSSSLGTSANKWSEIHGTEYYYGSNNVEFSTKFVTTDTNQTISGGKTFSSPTRIYNASASVQTDVPSLVLKNSLVERASTTLEGEQTILFTDKNDNNIGSIQAKTYTSGISDIILTSYSEYDGVKTTGIMIRRTPTTSKLQGYSDNITDLGDTNRRWRRVYAMSYYYGSDNIEFSTKFVTTDTNQTISGVKNFAVDVGILNTDTTANTPNLNLRNYKVDRGTTDTGVQAITFLDKNAKALTTIESRRTSNGSTGTNILTYNTDDSNNTVSGGVSIIKSKTSTNFAPNTDNAVTCGRALAKWSDVQTYKVNALEPSSLSLPGNKSDSIDISSYFTNTGTAQTNEYTVPANGYIYLQLSNIVTIHCFAFESASTTVATYIQTFSRGNDGQLYVLFPVRKNDVFKGTWYTSTTVTVSKAMFIPCQGNV